MNLQITGENSVKKIIAVDDTILKRDGSDMTLTVLRQIILHCGLEDRYQVEPASSLDSLCCKWVPYALVTEDNCLQGLPVFPICVSDVTAVRSDDTCHYTTFSMQEEMGADFVAANLRPLEQSGYAFDLMGLGIIGRIHLASDDEGLLRSTLIAASAALSCGISFADVVEVLNSLPVLHVDCCTSR